jgi:hypothetical protein
MYKGGFMKTLIIALGLVAMLFTAAQAEIKYISGYTRSDGTSVSGHYRDTSNDGVKWNNANELGYNK